MIKIDLARILAEKQECTLKQSQEFVNAAIDEIGYALERGERVLLAGFGCFEVRQRESRQGRNPKTGQELVIPSAKYPAFRAGKLLKERLNADTPIGSSISSKPIESINTKIGEPTPRVRKARSEK